MKLKSIYLTNVFFILLGGIVILFTISFVLPILFFWSKVVLLGLFGITILDILLIFMHKKPLHLERHVLDRLNLGDANEVELRVTNLVNQPLSMKILEGFPIDLQERSRIYVAGLNAGESQSFYYNFKPNRRGMFFFENCIVFISSVFRLVSRKIEIEAKQTVKVYPSVLQMKKYELMVFQQQKTASGIKKIRRLGNNSEFEQIRNYIQGDELKTVNWKATSRGRELMVNQYQEEKSQHIYCIIDKSRTMQMEFDGLSMLDYAINSTLVFSNITLKKGDKTGLITFSDKIGTQLPAEKVNGQLRRINEILYNQKTHFLEANFELLFESIRKTVKTRSLLVLYTNFETEFAMRRALPILRKINQKHVLVVVFFKNNELEEMAFESANTTREIYQTVVAEKMISVKGRIAQEMRQNGIYTVLTSPQELSINSINKYLELKAKGAI
ncbi:MAG: DUF58 domain-containing protein [Flavobacteriia bacterium]|nr:DUF58 domain-containing protein [Flavobacteriia bacterium]